MDNKVKYSIVIPLCNEELVIDELFSRLIRVMELTHEPFEIICVNDGSVDRTLDVLKRYSREDKRIKIISFSNNFGHQVAITAGLDYSRGEAVIVMDGDLQDPPEVIPKLVDKWLEGYEIVHAVREGRKGEAFFKIITSVFFSKLFKIITDIELPVNVGDFRLLSRKSLDSLNSLKGRHRFVRGFVSSLDYRHTGVTYIRERRYLGKTKYSLLKMLRFALDGFTSFSIVPLKIAIYFGIAAYLAISLFLISLVLFTIMYPTKHIAGFALFITSVVFNCGIQIIIYLLLYEYISKFYAEIKQIPPYFVQEKIGFD